MFKIGEYIIYGNAGVCRVKDITTMDVTGVEKNKLYYELSPVYISGSKVFTPVNNEKVIMRPVITKQETLDLIDEILGIEELWIPDERVREQTYKEALRSCDCRELIKIIKTLYERKQERIEDGKKATAVDDRYLKSAEEYLYGELAIALDMDRDQVKEYIEKRVEALRK
ncbi:MAG: CarD family transcriptional regulator [bacterium]|nr:CarD family transcriptional regulator [bacterium]